MSIHIEESGKIRCVVPDRSVNDLIKQKFEQLEPLEQLEQLEPPVEVVMVTKEDVPKKVIKSSTCIKTNLDQLKTS